MYKYSISALLAFALLIVTTPSHAKLVSTSGTVLLVVVSGDESPVQQVIFTMSFAPQPTGCSNTSNTTNQVFVFNPNDISDTQTRQNMLTMILTARITGMPLGIDFDNAGAACDSASGFPIPLFIGI